MLLSSIVIKWALNCGNHQNFRKNLQQENTKIHVKLLFVQCKVSGAIVANHIHTFIFKKAFATFKAKHRFLILKT